MIDQTFTTINNDLSLTEKPLDLNTYDHEPLHSSFINSPISPPPTPISNSIQQLPLAIPSPHQVNLENLNETNFKLHPFAPLQFASATEYDHQTQGRVTEIRPGLFVGHLVTDDNTTVHFGLEEMNETIRPAWKNYGNGTIIQSDLFSGFIAHHILKKDHQLDKNHTEEHWKDVKVDPLMKKMTDNPILKEYIGKPLIDLLIHSKNALAGFETNYLHEREKRFVAYASTKPINDFQFPKGKVTLKNFHDYANSSANIALFVSGGLRDQAIEHRGIAKPPLSHLNQLKGQFKNQKLFGGLSMALHFFGMAYTKQKNTTRSPDEQIQFFTVSPMNTMRKIMIKAFEDSNSMQHIETSRKKIRDRGWSEHERINLDGPIIVDISSMEIPAWHS